MGTTVGPQHAIGTRHPIRALASLQIVGKILNWLTGLFHLTPEENEDAGIYLNHRR